MKKILCVISVLILVGCSDITSRTEYMKCDGRVYRLTQPLIGNNKVDVRESGIWTNACVVKPGKLNDYEIVEKVESHSVDRGLRCYQKTFRVINFAKKTPRSEQCEIEQKPIYEACAFEIEKVHGIKVDFKNEDNMFVIDSEGLLFALSHPHLDGFLRDYAEICGLIKGCSQYKEPLEKRVTASMTFDFLAKKITFDKNPLYLKDMPFFSGECNSFEQ